MAASADPQLQPQSGERYIARREEVTRVAINTEAAARLMQRYTLRVCSPNGLSLTEGGARAEAHPPRFDDGQCPGNGVMRVFWTKQLSSNGVIEMAVAVGGIIRTTIPGTSYGDRTMRQRAVI